MNQAVSNIICSLVFGHRFEYGDEKFMKLMRFFDKALQMEGSIWAAVQCFKMINEIKAQVCSRLSNKDSSCCQKYLINMLMSLQLYNAFPLLVRHLPGPHNIILNIWKDVKDFIRVELKAHKDNWDPSDHRDYIDFYLNEIQMVIDNRCNFVLLMKMLSVKHHHIVIYLLVLRHRSELSTVRAW